MTTPVDDFLVHLATLCSAPSLAFEDDVLDLPIADATVLQIRPLGDDTVLLSAAAEVLPPLGSAEALTLLLAANHLGASTGAGRLGLDGGMILLSRTLPVAGLDVPAIREAIETFLGYVALWSGETAQRRLTPPVPADYAGAFVRV